LQIDITSTADEVSEGINIDDLLTLNDLETEK